MIIAYVSKIDTDCFSSLESDFSHIKNFFNIGEFLNFYAASRNHDVALVYRIDTLEDIELLNEVKFSKNVYIIVIGKSNTEFSLLAGKIGVDSYLTQEEATSNVVRELIIKSQTLIKERRGNSNISVFTGISGGVGTTTIAINLAKNISENHPEKNVLFLDFAYTKAVSNLFFECIEPKKTIIDIIKVQDLDMQEFFDNGLERLSNNFYFIPGIQKHTDREYLEKSENIQRFLRFINFIKEKFDYIIIDVGMFEDVELEIDIQEIADDIYVVTELSIPSMSILKTYIDIIDKSGWYNKTHILVNRADSFGTVTQSEAKKILSKGLKHEFEIHYSLPNDGVHLRECWNEAKLVNDVYPESSFMNSLEDFKNKFFMQDNTIAVNNLHFDTKPSSLMDKIKQWL